MNILSREMRAHRKSLFLWSCSIILMVFAGMSKFAGMSGSGQSMNELMADMPRSLQAVMGTSVFDLSKASGYYGILYLYLLIMTTVHAVMMGSTIISKEERDKTSEFLFVKPITRKKVITFKLIAAFINVLIINLVTTIASLSILHFYSNGEEGIKVDIGILMIGMFILQLLFLMLGSSLASVLKNPGKATSLSTGILLLMFLLSIIIDLNENLDFLRFITPFKYFEAKNMMYGGGFEAGYIIICIVLIFSLTIFTYTFFQKKDLNV